MLSSECTAWFAGAPESQRAQLLQLRTLIVSLEQDVVEEFKWSRPCYFNARGMFCYLPATGLATPAAPRSSRIDSGFNWKAQLRTASFARCRLIGCSNEADCRSR